jgi:hypothetical protein
MGCGKLFIGALRGSGRKLHGAAQRLKQFDGFIQTVQQQTIVVTTMCIV